MKLTLLRHATCIIEIENTKLLLDPIFYSKGTLDPANGGRSIRNPTVELKAGSIPLCKNIDAVLLTHPHRDHIDPAVIDILGADIPIICPRHYSKEVSNIGFSNIVSIADSTSFNGLSINLTTGHHGIGEIETLMGNSFGYLITSTKKEPLYITGDTVWCEEVKNILVNHNPKHILAFSGNANLNGHQITLNKTDLCKILSVISADAKLLPIHLEAWNHCMLRREELQNIDDRINILEDGESVDLTI